MRLRLFKSDFGTQIPKALHERFAYLLIHRKHTFLRGNHRNAVCHFIGMEYRPTSRGSANNVNPRPCTSIEIDLFNVLVPAERNGRRFPAIDAHNKRMIGRKERLSELLVVLHVLCACPISCIAELPDHLVVGVARNDTALAPRDECEDRLNLGRLLDFFLDAGNSLRDI